MNEKLKSLYESARDDEERNFAYILYCNTPIRGRTEGGYQVEIEKHRSELNRSFDVRNTTLDVFLDRVAEWLVTEEIGNEDGPTDPLEW